MNRFAYYEISENMSARDASDAVLTAKKAGYDNILVYHGKNADVAKGRYKEQILSVLRAGYRHKANIYLADDAGDCSGTAFGQLSSVKSLWQKKIVKIKNTDVKEEDNVLVKRGDEAVVARFFEHNERYPYGHLPDLTMGECANLLAEGVYRPLLNEFAKFKGYEFKGFLARVPKMKYENELPYSEAAVSKYGNDKLFALAEGEGREKYIEIFDECVREYFLAPLEKFCRENSMDFAKEMCGGEFSSIECEGEKIYKTRTPYEALCVYKSGGVPSVEIGADMDKIKNIGRIFEEYPSAEVCEADEFTLDTDCVVIKNTKRERLEFSILKNGDWCIYDWEKDELYDMGGKEVYSLCAGRFLCVVEKEAGMYTDKMPFVLTGILTGDCEDFCEVEFEKRDDKCAFYLPDCPLAECALKIEARGKKIRAKIGAMEYNLTQKDFVMPLFDFQREAGCVLECDGEIERIVILKKSTLK